MSAATRLVAGLILITVPTIQYGGYFLLTLLINKDSGYMTNPLRQNFFRAGHAHAGVIVILSLVCQVLADAAGLPKPLEWFARLAIPLAAILLPAGFFLSVASPSAAAPNRAVYLIYLGALVLAAGVIILGVGLVRGGARA
jgi:Ni,Fe-hydrogenase I cytochrome b subunit